MTVGVDVAYYIRAGVDDDPRKSLAKAQADDEMKRQMEDLKK